MDHVEVNMRGMGRMTYMRCMCMYSVYISQNKGALYIGLSDMKVTQKSGTFTSISVGNTTI